MKNHSWMGSGFLLAGVIFAMASCAAPPQGAMKSPGTPRIYCQYQASSSQDLAEMSGKVFVFPPLLADAKGKPLESLSPVHDAEGGIKDWACSSERSRRIRKSVETALMEKGFQVVDFSEVIQMEKPHSVVILSLFYTKPVSIEPKKKDAADRCIMTMIRAKSFDVDLDMQKARAVSDVDGATYFLDSYQPQDLEERSLRSLIEWMGDDVSGVTNL
jgi:hypothetical protein